MTLPTILKNTTMLTSKLRTSGLCCHLASRSLEKTLISTPLQYQVCYYYYARARRKKGPHKVIDYEKLTSFEHLFGRSVCQIALKKSTRSILELLLLERWRTEAPGDGRVKDIISMAQSRNIKTSYYDRTALDNLTNGSVHQGVCLRVSQLNYMDKLTFLDDMEEQEEGCKNRRTVPLWLYLYQLKDLMNLGNILRSSYYFGIDRVVVSENSPPLTPIVSKASSGACEMMTIFSSSSKDGVDVVLRDAQIRKWDIVGTVAGGNTINNLSRENIHQSEITKPTIIIIGSEGTGIADNIIRNYCTRLVTIPMFHSDYDVDSLNVGSASAVILSQYRNSVNKLQAQNLRQKEEEIE